MSTVPKIYRATGYGRVCGLLCMDGGVQSSDASLPLPHPPILCTGRARCKRNFVAGGLAFLLADLWNKDCHHLVTFSRCLPPFARNNKYMGNGSPCNGDGPNRPDKAFSHPSGCLVLDGRMYTFLCCIPLASGIIWQVLGTLQFKAVAAAPVGFLRLRFGAGVLFRGNSLALGDKVSSDVESCVAAVHGVSSLW